MLKLPVKRIKATKTTENLVNFVWSFNRRSSPSSLETVVRMVGIRIMELKRIPPIQVNVEIRWIQKFSTLKNSNTTPFYKKNNGEKGNEESLPFSKLQIIGLGEMALANERFIRQRTYLWQMEWPPVHCRWTVYLESVFWGSRPFWMDPLRLPPWWP